MGLLYLALVGCGEDDIVSIYVVYISADPDELTDDGSESARISIQVLDQDNTPAPAGTRIVLFARTDTGNDTGTFGATGSAFQVLFLEGGGSAVTSFVCTERATVILAGRLDDGTAGYVSIDCANLYPGNWQIRYARADRPCIRPNAQTTISALAESAGGEPVISEPLEFRVTNRARSGDNGFSTRKDNERIQASDTYGVASVTYVAGGQEDVVDITVNYVNRDHGNDQTPLQLEINPDCTDTASVQIIPGSSNLRADGTSQQNLVVRVTEAGGLPAVDVEVTVEVERGRIKVDGGGPTTNPTNARTDDNGEVPVVYIAGTEPGTARVTASVSGAAFDEPLEGRVEGEASIRLILVGEVIFLSISVSPLGIRGSLLDESTRVCFRVVDIDGVAYPAGQEVGFFAATTSNDANVVDDRGFTDANGEVCVTVFSGTTSGQITVEARVEVGATEVSGFSDPIPVVGVIPSRAGMSLVCTNTNIGALRWQRGDEIIDPPTGDLCTTCRLNLIDRVGNPIGFRNQVTFVAESGHFEPSSITHNDIDGQASVLWCANGTLPEDVTPVRDEASWVDSEGNIYNLRDGLVSIIAYVSGEEEFDDINENGVWDEEAGPDENEALFPEPFWDLSEPFVDADDDNIYNPEMERERHIDVTAADDSNIDGVFDQGNDRWDADTVIWVETRVLITGNPTRDIDDIDDTHPGTRPDFLSWDSDYPRIPNLSHFFVQEILSVIPPGANYYHGYDLAMGPPPPEDSTLRWDITYVMRDLNGNAMNPSLDSVTLAFDTPACTSAIELVPQPLVPSGGYLIGAFDIYRDNSEDLDDKDYEIEINLDSFHVGSRQTVVVVYKGELPSGGCRLTFGSPLSACTSCGDPASSRQTWIRLIGVVE
jgi:hypothetical protein